MQKLLSKGNMDTVQTFLLSPEDVLIDFRERRREGGREERNTDRLSLVCAPTGNQTHNPDMCFDWEPNPQPLGLLDDAQPTEPHRPGPLTSVLNVTPKTIHSWTEHLRRTCKGLAQTWL